MMGKQGKSRTKCRILRFENKEKLMRLLVDESTPIRKSNLRTSINSMKRVSKRKISYLTRNDNIH